MRIYASAQKTGRDLSLSLSLSVSLCLSLSLYVSLCLSLSLSPLSGAFMRTVLLVFDSDSLTVRRILVCLKLH